LGSGFALALLFAFALALRLQDWDLVWEWPQRWRRHVPMFAFGLSRCRRLALLL